MCLIPLEMAHTANIGLRNKSNFLPLSKPLKIKNIMKQFIGEKCIVRCNHAGVFFGTIAEINHEVSGVSVTMSNVRKIWYWEGACAVEQIAQDGVSTESKLTITVAEMEILDVIQIIPCSEKAIKNLEGQKEWKR